MTGFGRAERAAADLRVAVEVRSVNHRFLDLQLRLPERWRGLEPWVRQVVGERLVRGRVDLTVEVAGGATRPVRARLDVDRVRDLFEQASTFEGMGRAPLELRDVLGLPGVVSFEELGDQPGAVAGGEAMIQAAVEEALAVLASSRESEGRALRESLEKALSRLEEWGSRIRAAREPARRELLERHRARVEELVGEVEIDPARLAQEAALLAERSDFEEELERLEGHLRGFRSGVGADGAIGKRLDFLAQEIHRELNTLGVKCRDGGIATLVIEAKVECDRLREQLLNVE